MLCSTYENKFVIATMNKVNKPFVSMLAIEILIHSTQEFF